MKRSDRRFYRTLFLGLAALGLMVWTAMDQFGISRQEMASLLLGAVLSIAVVVCVAGIAAALWMGLRYWLGRWRS